MPISSTKKFNLPLPDELHSALFREAKREGVPATRLARAAIESWLEQRRKERRREEIRRFAQRHAGGEYDLDRDLESVAVEELRTYDEDAHETR